MINPRDTRIWHFFKSVRLTVVLLLILAATSVIGTLIPQNEELEAYVHTYGEFWFRLLFKLHIFDMYHSWWFQFLLILLAVNIVVCSWDRLSLTWKVIFNPPAFSRDRFKNDCREEFTADYPADQLKTAYEPVVASQFGPCTVHPTETGFCLFAEKGRKTRLGVYAVHFSVVLLLFGGLIGSMFGFEGFVNIPEGGSTNHIRLKKTDEIKPLDFEIRCDKFSVSFYHTGAPKEYRSALTIIEGGKPVFQKDIIVNAPLRYKGVSIYQSSYGALPPDDVTIHITSSESKMVYTQKAKMDETFDLPEGLGRLKISGFKNSYNFMGRNLGETFIATLNPDSEDAKDIVLPKRFPNFDKMRQGTFIVSIADHTHKYYTGVQVTKDPGVWLVYSGFVVMILGIYITFFMSHQRVCVEVTERKGKSHVVIMGNANKNRLGMRRVVRKLTQRLTSLLS